jgi:arylsulfatase
LGYEGSTGDPLNQGFDQFYGYLCQVHAHNHYPRYLFRNGEKELQPGNTRGASGESYSQDRFVEFALEFLNQQHGQTAAEGQPPAEGAPFFLYLPFCVPHLAIQVPEPSLAEYLDEIEEEPYEHRGYIQHPHPRAGYAAMVTHMDSGIGRIIERLEQLGMRENTLVLFTSDNGPTHDRVGGSDSDFFQSSGPFRGRKGSLWEGGIRVPFIACWPGVVPAGTTCEHACAFWDFLPTLCEVAEVEPPEQLDGLSFLPALRGKYDEQPQHEFLYWDFPGYGGQQAVRMNDWKAIRVGLHKQPDAPFELYHLADDPGELRNVAEHHPDVLARLRAIAAREHTRSELFPFPALD